MGDQHLGWVRELRKALDPIRGNYARVPDRHPTNPGFLTVNALVAASMA